MAKVNPLFNIAKLVSDDGKDTPIEVSFLQDLDFTLRQMNKHEPHYYFKNVTEESNPDLFDNPVFVELDELPEKCSEEYLYDKNHTIYNVSNGTYYIGVYHDGKPSRRYKPSSMKCIRNMFYQIIGADLDPEGQKSGEFYSICESGTDRHLRIQSAISKMKKYGIDCEYVDVEDYIKEHNIENLVIEGKEEFETKVYDAKRNIIFLCDGILKYKGKYIVLECKTESSFKFVNRTYVDDSHRIQAYTYSLELGIDDVLFVYENRDVCTKKSYILTVTQENRDFIEKRIKDCDFYVDSKVVPPKDPEITKKICQYCDYKMQCKVDDCI